MESDKKKIAIVLFNRQYIRSWIDTGLLRDLLDTGEFDVTVFIPNHVLIQWADAGQYKTSVIESIQPTKAATNLVALSWVALRSRSSTFRFSFERKTLSTTTLPRVHTHRALRLDCG